MDYKYQNITKEDLSQILKRMVKEAQKGEITEQYLLFGIKYAEIIKEGNYTADDISELAGLSRKYGIEIRKGIRLSRHVYIK